MPDDDLDRARPRESSQQLGLVDAERVEAGYVVRMPKAYPVYDDDYTPTSTCIADWLAEHARNVHPVGRNGMHKYNNQDHSMYTAMLAVENIVRRRTTTSGRSTSRRSTTRPATTTRAPAAKHPSPRVRPY